VSGDLKQGIGSMMGPLAAVAAGAVSAAGTFALLKRSIGGAADFESFESSFVTLLGSTTAAKRRMEELEEFGRTTPFELPGVVKASKVLESLTQGALSTGPGLTMVGDAAASADQPVEELAVHIGRLYDGLQTGRAVGESLARLQELALISGETRGEIEKLQKEGAAGEQVWGVAQTALGRFSGEMDRKSKTWNGLMSNFKDGVDAAFRAFGQPLMESLKPALKSAIDETGQLTENAKQWGKQVADVVKLLTDAFQQGKTNDLIRAGLEVAVASFGNKLINAMEQGATALATAISSSFENGLFPALAKGFEGLAFGFSASLSSTIPDSWLALQRKVAGPGTLSIVQKDLKNQGMIEGSFSNRSLTDKGRAKAAELGIDLDDLGFFETAVYRFEQAMTDKELDLMFDKGTIVAEQTNMAAAKLAESGRMLAAATPKIAADMATAMAKSGSGKDFYGQSAAEANFERIKANIEKAGFKAFDPKTLFGMGPNKEGFLGGLDSFRAALLGDAAPAPATTSPAQALGNATAGIQQVAADRLARIGGFVGGTSPATNHARQTADNTKKQIGLIEKTNNYLQTLVERPGGGGSATWARG